MPVTRVGFHLKPFGFFDGNPMLDLPAETPSCHAGGEGEGEGSGCRC
jgi:primary-amine oxidase